MNLPVFDLHCDTITRLNTGERLEPGDRSLRRNGAHIDLERMEGLSWCQCFAVFMPDGLRGRAAIDYYEQSLRINGDNPEVIFNEAMAYSSLGQTDQANELFGRVIMEYEDSQYAEEARQQRGY